MAERPWRPWRALRERPDIEFVLCDLPPGIHAIYGRRGEDRAILVSRSLSPAERLAAIAHELVHDERGHAGHHPDFPQFAPDVVREERRVERIVARRILPLEALAAYVDAVSDFEPVTVDGVAVEFDVSRRVAERALTMLAQERRAG